MTYTTNYKLPTWAEDDRIQRVDFNSMTSKIDAVLKAEETARINAVNSLNTAVTKKGNCLIYTYTYQGTGTYGEGNPTVIPFPRQAFLLLVFDNRNQSYVLTPKTEELDFHLSDRHVYGYLTWGTTYVSIQSTAGAMYQLNHTINEYRVIAFYRADE